MAINNAGCPGLKWRDTIHEIRFTNLPLCSFVLLYLPAFTRLLIYELRTTNNELCAKLSYSAQFNIMLKYKNVKFLQHFAQKVRDFAYFCQISDTFLHVFAPFFSCPFCPNHPCCQSTSIYRLKTNTLKRRTKKNLNFPPFFKI